MKLKIVFFLLVIFVFSGAAEGQETESIESAEIQLPEKFKQDVVRRILVLNFKPAKRQKVIYLASQDINSSWLPKITNIKFKLLSAEELEDGKRKVYFFTNPTLENKTYSLGFGFGSPNCNYTGEVWSFRIIRNKLKLWRDGQMGGGCGSGLINSVRLYSFTNLNARRPFP